MTKSPAKASPRTQARRYAALALYQWHLTREAPATIKQHMLDDPEWLDALAGSLSGADEDEPPDARLRFKFNLDLFESCSRACPPT
jgi:N utilization substance protein B